MIRTLAHNCHDGSFNRHSSNENLFWNRNKVSALPPYSHRTQQLWFLIKCAKSRIDNNLQYLVDMHLWAAQTCYCFKHPSPFKKQPTNRSYVLPFSKLRSCSITESTTQITPQTKNNHAPPHISFKKELSSCQWLFCNLCRTHTIWRQPCLTNESEAIC